MRQPLVEGDAALDVVGRGRRAARRDAGLEEKGAEAGTGTQPSVADTHSGSPSHMAWSNTRCLCQATGGKSGPITLGCLKPGATETGETS